MALVKLVGFNEMVLVEDDMLGVVREIARLYPNLTVQFLDPDRALLEDPPYRIVEHTPQGLKQVMAVWQLDKSVLDRLHAINSYNVDVEKAIEEHNAKVKKEKEYKKAEELGQAADVSASAINHLGAGKMKFQYRNEAGEKRVIREDGTRN